MSHCSDCIAQSCEADRSVNLHFRVSLDLVLEGKMCPIRQMMSSKGLGITLDPALVNGQVPPPKFFVCAWFGGKSTEVCVAPVSDDGIADLSLPVRAGDLDTLKISTVFNVHELATTPRGARNCHLASDFTRVSDFIELLGQASDGRTEDCQRVLCLRDNFTKNAAVLRVANLSTDLEALRAVPLQASVLNNLEGINNAVTRMGKRVQSMVEQCSILQCNAGPQYISAYTCLPMANVVSHYAILGMTMRSVETPVELPMLMYDAYLAVQSTGIHPSALASMPDVDLITYFGTSMITQHTGCERTCPYSSDVTLNRAGQACRETEFIRRSLSSVALLTQGVTRPFVRKGAITRMSVQQIIPVLCQVVSDYGTPKYRPGMGGEVCRDDCETQTFVNMQKAMALKAIYPTLLGAGIAPGDMQEHLSDMMFKEHTAMPAIFGKLSRSHHTVMAGVLIRLSQLLHDGSWSVELGVVSAKSNSFRADMPDGASLNGHATGISRVKEGPAYLHAMVEGTTYLRMTPPGHGKGVKAKVLLTNGQTETYCISELGSAISTNTHEIAGFTIDSRILAHLPCDVPAGQDPLLGAPFYVAAFYTSLGQGEHGSLGCVPVDTRGGYGLGASSSPAFGAPAMGLSLPTTLAMPIHSSMFAESEEADPLEGEKYMEQVQKLASEVWSPAASRKTMDLFMSYYEPCEVPDGPNLRKDYKNFIQCENTWAFDNPDHTTMATKLYTTLAAKFNTLQSQDPENDGTIASAHGKYRSSSLVLSVNMPPVTTDGEAKLLKLSCMRNLRRAVKELGMQELTASTFKTRTVSARAQVPTEHYVYMCGQGTGFVHSHRVKLA